MSGPGDVVLDAAELRAIALRLAREISSDHPEGVVLVGVLGGCLCFLADLARSLSVACKIDFLALSSFSGVSPRVRVLKDLDLDVSASSVVLVEDIVDTGLSARYVTSLLAAHGAASVEVCTLLDRPRRRIVPVPLRYIGVEAPDDFLVGYGLDFAGRYRNLPDLHRAEVAALEADLGVRIGEAGLSGLPAGLAIVGRPARPPRAEPTGALSPPARDLEDQRA